MTVVEGCIKLPVFRKSRLHRDADDFRWVCFLMFGASSKEGNKLVDEEDLQ